MARFIKGDVVVVPFPFSDLSSSKRRPALVLANLVGDDIILCQITSQYKNKDHFTLSLNDSDLKSGSLQRSSYIRITRIFTADENIIIKKIGTIDNAKIKDVTDNLIKLFKK